MKFTCLICNKTILSTEETVFIPVDKVGLDTQSETVFAHPACIEKLYLRYNKTTRLLYYLGYKPLTPPREEENNE